MDSQLISQGLDLMLYGMGTVFIFLTVLVAITTIMSTTVNKIAPEQVEDSKIKAPQAQVETRIVKAIQAAINQHRGVWKLTRKDLSLIILRFYFKDTQYAL